MEQSKSNLILQLVHGEHSEVVKAIKQLASHYSHDQEVLSMLLKFFDSTSYTLQTYAITAVRQIASNFDNIIIEGQLIPTIFRRMQSSFEFNRESYKELLLLLKTLKKIDDPLLTDILIKNSSNPLIGERTIEALSEIKQPDDKIIEAIYIALKHKNENIRKAAANFLKKHNLSQEKKPEVATSITVQTTQPAAQTDIAELEKKLVNHEQHSAFELQGVAEKLIKLIKEEEAEQTNTLKTVILSTLLRNLDTQDAGIQQRAARSLADMQQDHPKAVMLLIHYYYHPTVYIPYTPIETKDLCRKALVTLGYKIDKLPIVAEALTNNNLLSAIIKCQIETTEKYLSVLPLPEDIKRNCRKIAKRELLEKNSIADGILYNQTLTRIAPHYYIFYQNLGCYQHAAAQQAQSDEEKHNLLSSAENNFKKAIGLNPSTGTLVEYSLFLVVNQRYEETKRYLAALADSDTTLGYSDETKETLTDLLKTIIEEVIELQISAKTLAYYLLMECHYSAAQAKPENQRTKDYAQVKLNFNKLKKQLEITPCDFAEQLISLIQEKFSTALPKTQTSSSNDAKSPQVTHAEQMIVIQGDINVSGSNQIHGFFANKLELTDTQQSSATAVDNDGSSEDTVNITLGKN